MEESQGNDGATPSRPASHFLIPDLLTARECDALEAALTDQGGTCGLVAGGRADPAARRARVRFLRADAPDHRWLGERLETMIARVNAEAFGFDLDGPPRQVQLAEYAAEDGGDYGWHVDRGRAGGSARRKLTLAVALSAPDGFKGGDLHLNAGGQPLQVPRARGLAIVFPSYVVHRVTPVFMGVRRSLVAWFTGPDFR